MSELQVIISYTMQTVLLFPGGSNDEAAEELLAWFRDEACEGNGMTQHEEDIGYAFGFYISY